MTREEKTWVKMQLVSIPTVNYIDGINLLTTCYRRWSRFRWCSTQISTSLGCRNRPWPGFAENKQRSIKRCVVMQMRNVQYMAVNQVGMDGYIGKCPNGLGYVRSSWLRKQTEFHYYLYNHICTIRFREKALSPYNYYTNPPVYVPRSPPDRQIPSRSTILLNVCGLLNA
jgi:hypothetical protein